MPFNQIDSDNCLINPKTSTHDFEIPILQGFNYEISQKISTIFQCFFTARYANSGAINKARGNKNVKSFIV